MGRVPCAAGRPPAKHGKCCAAPTNVPLETRGVCTQDERDGTYEQDPGHDSWQTAGDWTHAAKWTQQNGRSKWPRVESSRAKRSGMERSRARRSRVESSRARPSRVESRSPADEVQRQHMHAFMSACGPHLLGELQPEPTQPSRVEPSRAERVEPSRAMRSEPSRAESSERSAVERSAVE